MKVSLIAAMGRNRVIGRKGQLPWHLPADLEFFKKTTWGHYLLMGRKTFESVGKALPGRKNVVITRSDRQWEDVLTANSLKEALSLVPAGESETFIAGGAEIYRQSLELADRIYLTLIHAEFEGDAFFPEVDEDRWREAGRIEVPADEKNRYSMTFLTLDKKD